MMKLVALLLIVAGIGCGAGWYLHQPRTNVRTDEKTVAKHYVNLQADLKQLEDAQRSGNANAITAAEELVKIDRLSIRFDEDSDALQARFREIDSRH